MQTGTHTKRGRTTRRAKLEKVLDAGGKLSKAELLHCRVRYFSDGVVLGSKALSRDHAEATGCSAYAKAMPRQVRLRGVAQGEVQ